MFFVNWRFRSFVQYLVKTEEIRSVLIKTTGIFLHHYFLGLIAGPWFPNLEIMAIQKHCCLATD